MLVRNEKGGYAFLRGMAPYSAGARALAGFEIEHARLVKPLPLKQGFDAVAARLKALGRPRQALCGMELRSPRPFSFQGFIAFNAGYITVLQDWGLMVEGLNPVARTNVAPEVAAPAEPSLYGFSYTVPARPGGVTFVVAGAGELPEGSLDPHDVVRRGETSAEALLEKARFVLGLMDGRLRGLEAGWDQVTQTEVYTVHNLYPFIREVVRTPHGFTWHYARPPIVSIEYEMDLRCCRREVVLG